MPPDTTAIGKSESPDPPHLVFADSQPSPLIPQLLIRHRASSSHRIRVASPARTLRNPRLINSALRTHFGPLHLSAKSGAWTCRGASKTGEVVELAKQELVWLHRQSLRRASEARPDEKTGGGARGGG